MPEAGDFELALRKVTAHILKRHSSAPSHVLPSPSSLTRTLSSLPELLPDIGLGTSSTTSFLLDTILAGTLQHQAGPRYFGFVTGGVTPAAQVADILVGEYDENVTLALPAQTAASAIESRTLEMVLDLLQIPRTAYLARTITTGATASNVLGLACARDHLYATSRRTPKGYSFAQSGPPPNLPTPPIRILGLHQHFSILKAAALVGLGSGPQVVHSVPPGSDELSFDLPAFEVMLRKEEEDGRGVVVVYQLGEVNTGGFPAGLRDVANLCRDYGAWLHVDAAFGGFAGVLPELAHLVDGIDLADSLTLDGHKWLNVPYDCGLFFTRHSSSLTAVFAPPATSAPAYLATSSTSTKSDAPTIPGTVSPVEIVSPMYLGIENSRRFRALPLFASLMSLGRDGYQGIIRRNIRFAQQVAAYLQQSTSFDLLNHQESGPIVPLNIVLFAPSSTSQFSSAPDPAKALTDAINATRRMYVTGTKWRGVGAVRLAVSNWQTGSGGNEEFEAVRQILEDVACQGQ